MRTHRVPLGGLAAALRNEGAAIEEEVLDGLRAGGNACLAVIVPETPVDTGMLKNGWRVEEQADGVDVYNPVPYAGIVDHRQGFVEQNVGRMTRAAQAEVERKLGKGPR